MKMTLKKLTACLLVLMMVFQIIPTFADTYISDPVETDSTLLEKLRIINSKSSVLEGQTIHLSVPEGYENVRWSSADTSIASVEPDEDNSAVVTGEGAGYTTITAESDGKSTTITITVFAREATEDETVKNVTVLVTVGKQKIAYDGQPHPLTYTLTQIGGDADFDLTKVVLNRTLPERTEPGATISDLEPDDFSYDGDSYNVTFQVENGYVRITPPEVGDNQFYVKHIFTKGDGTKETIYEVKNYENGTYSKAYPVQYDSTFYEITYPKEKQYSYAEREIGSDGLVFEYSPKEITYNVQFHLYGHPAKNGGSEVHNENGQKALYGSIVILKHDYDYLKGYKFIGVYKDPNNPVPSNYVGDGSFVQVIDSNSKYFGVRYEWVGDDYEDDEDAGMPGFNKEDTTEQGASTETGTSDGEGGEVNPYGELIHINVGVDEVGQAAGANYSPNDHDHRELEPRDEEFRVFNWDTNKAEFDHWGVYVDGTEVYQIPANSVSDYEGRGVKFIPQMDDDPNAEGKWTNRTYIAHFKKIENIQPLYNLAYFSTDNRGNKLYYRLAKTTIKITPGKEGKWGNLAPSDYELELYNSPITVGGVEYVYGE